MQVKPWRIALFVGLLFLLGLTLSISSQLQLPGLSGPFEVGRTILRWVDSSRLEVLTEDSNDFREVAAAMWYPAEAGSGLQADYFPNLSPLSGALMQSGEVQWWQVLGLHFVRSEMRLDASPVKTKEPFPVVIFSPGGATNIEFYSSLASEIASHGYIVLGLNHPYDVAAVELSDGKVAPYDKDQWHLEPTAHQAYLDERIKVRTADILFALEQLEALNAMGRFAGVMDLDSIAAAGHSLGGITASEACKAELRFQACLNFDGLQKGGPFSMEETAIPPQQPFLFLTKESQLHPKLIKRFETMQEAYWVIVHGASHQSFTDSPLLQPTLVPGPNQADRWMSLIQKYTLSFLDDTLKGRPRALLSKTVDHRDVSVKVFPSE